MFFTYLAKGRFHDDLCPRARIDSMPLSLNRRMLLAGVFFTTASSIAMASVDPKAANYVKSLTDQVVKLANSNVRGKALKSRFSQLLSRYVSMRQIANFALGTYQKKLPAKDRDMFYGLVSNYAASLFAYYADDFKGNAIEVTDTSKQGSFTTVSSAIKKGGGGEKIRWRLSSSGGGYSVADVNIKGVWLTISMKKRFNDVLNRSKGDFSALYAELREAETW
jgi:phospholipid transport system substrate-binding protein